MMRWIISGTALLLIAFIVLAIAKRGEVLQELTGEVQKCSVLGGTNKARLSNAISHATIKADDGRYLIASIKNCNPNIKVTIFIQRGALFFNTVYTAEES